MQLANKKDFLKQNKWTTNNKERKLMIALNYIVAECEIKVKFEPDINISLV